MNLLINLLLRLIMIPVALFSMACALVVMIVVAPIAILFGTVKVNGRKL